VADQGGDLWFDTKIYVILDTWRDTSIYRSCRFNRYMLDYFHYHSTPIFIEYFSVGNHIHCRDEIGGEGHFHR
jgi:hypothetical protein